MVKYSVREENGVFNIDLYGRPCRGFCTHATLAEAAAAIRSMNAEDDYADEADARYSRMYDF